MKLMLGTAQFGMNYGIANSTGQCSTLEIEKILNIAKSASIDYLDTAVAYGQSESNLGIVGVNSFNVTTKLPAIPSDDINVFDWALSLIKQSISRLGTQSLYGVLLHNPQDLFGKHGKHIIRLLNYIKNVGLAPKVGVSIYDPVELNSITEAIEIDIVQAPLNLIDRRIITSGWLDRLCKSGIEVHTRSVFLQGLLLLPRDKMPTYFERWAHIWDGWHERTMDIGISAISTCLQFPLNEKNLKKVIVGVDSGSQLEEILFSINQNESNIDLGFMEIDDNMLINPKFWEIK